MEQNLDYLDMAEEQVPSNIMVIGVGGGGGNAVRYMYDVGIHNIYFMVCNTDAQALRRSPVPLKIQFGQGLGAGNDPEKGRLAALDSSDEIREQLVASGVQMVFITAGMGGGTGTGAAPVVAQIASELNILTVAIVTIPFRYEGPRRLRQAQEGLNEIKKYVDSLLVIDNENICKMYGDLSFSEAFGKADDILAIAAKGIAETITKEHTVNVDFADVRSTMTNSGIAIMGYADSKIDSENVAIQLTEAALLSPLLNKNNIVGATKVLINISWNKKELTMNDVRTINAHVQAAAGSNANIIWGAGVDSSLEEDQVSIIIIATGFDNHATMELGDDVTAQNWGAVTIDIDQQEAELQEAAQCNATPKDAVTEPTTQPEALEESQAEAEYMSLDEEQQQPSAEQQPAAVNEDGDEDIQLVEAKPEVVTEAKPEAKPVASEPLKAPKAVEVVSHNVSQYTIDDLENIPAYKRRQIMAELEQLNQCQCEKVVEKLKLDLGEL